MKGLFILILLLPCPCSRLVQDHAPSGPSSAAGTTQFETGLFDVVGSYVEYTPNLCVVNLILASRKRRSLSVFPVAPPKKSCGQSSSSHNILIGEVF